MHGIMQVLGTKWGKLCYPLKVSRDNKIGKKITEYRITVKDKNYPQENTSTSLGMKWKSFQ